MFIYTLKFDKKKAVFAVIIAALIIIGIILLVGANERKNAGAAASPRAENKAVENRKAIVNVRNEKHRVTGNAAPAGKTPSLAVIGLGKAQ